MEEEARGEPRSASKDFSTSEAGVRLKTGVRGVGLGTYRQDSLLAGRAQAVRTLARCPWSLLHSRPGRCRRRCVWVCGCGCAAADCVRVGRGTWDYGIWRTKVLSAW